MKAQADAWLAYGALVLVCAAAAFAGDESYALPADAPRATADCNADGNHDCTQAIRDAVGSTWSAWEIIYLPAGTYLVSGRIDYGRFLTMRGDGPGKTIIKLADNASGYSDPNNPESVIRAWRGCCEPGGSHDNATHSIHLMNLTIDVGSGNAGAIGVDFIAHNGGGIENVEIVAADNSGYKGISLDREANGPCLLNRISITGFDYGISVGWGVYGTVFEDITLTDQRVAGMINDYHPVSIRHLTSTNTVPAITSTTTSYGILVILDSEFGGGSSSTVAIESEGGLYARNVTASGYGSVLKNGSQTFDGMALDEFTSTAIRQTVESPDRSLNLPVKDMYVPQLDPPSEWVSVRDYEHLKSGDNWGPAIQAAIDAGKTTVYFPSTTHAPYPSSQDIHVRGAVRNIIGMYASLGNGKLVFDTEDPEATIYVEQMRADAGYEHTSPATVVMRRCMGGTIRTYPASGDLFVDDWCCGSLDVEGSSVWLRSFNEESNNVKIRNNGGTIWMLGLKTEQYNTVGHFTNGAATEILGCLIYPAQGQGDVMYINDNSAFAAFHREMSPYATFAREIHDGVTREVNPDFQYGTFYVTNPDGVGGAPAPTRSVSIRADHALPVGVSGNRLYVRLAPSEPFLATVTDLSGRQLLRVEGAGTRRLPLGAGGISAGIRLIRVRARGKLWSRTIAIQR
jgi:hypothetical protein